MKMTFGGYPLYAPDPYGELVKHINQYVWPMMLQGPQSERSPIYSKACEPLEPLRTPSYTPCPLLSLYQLYYPGGWDNYARMFVLMRSRDVSDLVKNKPHGLDTELGPITYRSEDFPKNWGVFPFRAMWTNVAPATVNVPIFFPGNPLLPGINIPVGERYDIEIPMIVNRVQPLGGKLDIGSDATASEIELNRFESEIDEITLVELVDWRWRLRQERAPHIKNPNPTWKDFVRELTVNLPRLYSYSSFYHPNKNSAAGGVYGNDEGLGNPDLSQLNRPGVPVTKILDAWFQFGNSSVISHILPITGNNAFNSFWKSPAATEHVIVMEDGDEFSNAGVAGGYDYYEQPDPLYQIAFDFLFPAFVNGKHRPDLPGWYVRDQWHPLGYDLAGRVTVTSSQPARFRSLRDACPYNLADLQNYAYVNSANYVNKTLGSAAQGRLFFASSPRKGDDFFDFALVDFLCPTGPTTIIKHFSHDQLQLHCYAVLEQPVKQCEEVRRVKLIENLPTCNDAMAYLLSDSDVIPTGYGCEPGTFVDRCPCNIERVVFVRDTAGVARTNRGTGGEFNQVRFAPANSMGFVRPLRCPQTGDDIYELISVGEGCCKDTPPDSSGEPCCVQWFTKFEHITDVLPGKNVGDEVAFGAQIGKISAAGNEYYLNYKAYISASNSGGTQCAIDLSSIHEFTQKNRRNSLSAPCDPQVEQCAIDHALLKMATRLPIRTSDCGDWYEDLASAGSGADYFRRTIRTDSPENCAWNKPVFNFTSAKTTIAAISNDSVTLKHECEPISSSSSSSSSEPDPCCVTITDYDVRCVSGQLQRWKQETEICWNGDCLEKRVVSEWANTGSNAGCCKCDESDSSDYSASGSSSNASSESSSSGDENCCKPCCGCVWDSPDDIWNACPIKVKFTIGEKTYTAFVNFNLLGCGKSYLFSIGEAVSGSSGIEPPLCMGEPFCNPRHPFQLDIQFRCGIEYGVGLGWEIFAQYTYGCSQGTFLREFRPSGSSCPIPFTASGVGTFPNTTPYYNTTCPWSIEVTCADGSGSGSDPGSDTWPDPDPWPPGEPRGSMAEMKLLLGDQAYDIELQGGGAGNEYPYLAKLETSTIPSQLLDDNFVGGPSPDRLRLTVALLKADGPVAQPGWRAAVIYELYQPDGSLASAGRILEYGFVVGGESNPIGQTWNNTGTTQLLPNVPFNTDISWSISINDDAGKTRLGPLTSRFISSDRPIASSMLLDGASSNSTAVIADKVFTGAFALEGVKIAGGDLSCSVFATLSGVSLSSSYVLAITCSAEFFLDGATVNSSFFSNTPE